jgi:hypothetical protein
METSVSYRCNVIYQSIQPSALSTLTRAPVSFFLEYRGEHTWYRVELERTSIRRTHDGSQHVLADLVYNDLSIWATKACAVVIHEDATRIFVDLSILSVVSKGPRDSMN